MFDVLQLWAVTDEDERQQEREHPLEDHDPSLPAKNDLSGQAIWTRPVWTPVLSAAAN